MLLSLFPLIVLVILGYLSLRFSKLSTTTVQELSKVTFHVLFPLFLFINIATSDLSGTLSYSVFMTFYGGVLLTFLASFVWGLKSQRLKQNSAAVIALGATYSNTIIVGLPILLRVISEEVAALVFVIISFHSAMLFAMTSILATNQDGGRFDLVRFSKGLVTNPLLIGIFLGLCTSYLGIELPVFVVQTFELITAPALTLALFILGANLYQYHVKGHIGLVLSVSLIKLVLLPLFVWLLADSVFELAEELVLILVILTACPTGVNAYIVACQQQVKQSVVASSVVVTTVLSAITIPIWLLLLNR